MTTPGYEFDRIQLKNIEGPLESNLGEEDLKNAGVIFTENKKGKTRTFTLDNWFSSMLSQKGLKID